MSILKLLKKNVPYFIKRNIRNYFTKRKYDVIFHKGAESSNTFYEGENILRINTKLSNCSVGFATTISENTRLSKAQIGRYSSIGQNVYNSLTSHPTEVFVSTYPGFYLPSEERLSFSNEVLYERHKYIDSEKKYYIEIGSDVWIGNNVIILDGVKVGDGAVIATGAVVTKDVEPYSIVGGVPAKLIKYRFSKKQRDFLISFKWWEKDIEWINNNNNSMLNIDKLIEENL